VKDYVEKHGGNKVIDTILIANNGIAAVKCMNSVRKWAYATFGDERAIQFVVMATPEDLKANAEYIRMADQIEEVPGGSNSNNYANVDLILDIAERRGVQAVWAGWGHASENPKLPESLGKSKHNIAFIGPPAKAMRDLGDKIASTLVAQYAKVNCVPWNGSHVICNYGDEGIPDSIYEKATVRSLEEALEVMETIGVPAMIKASEGGGGKGIRKVLSFDQVESAFRQVQGEVPGSPIFIMKMVKRARHLEVQILGDQYGNAIALYGRDCSVQRRHQKIIEEGPPIIAPRNIWEEMERAAVRLTKAVGYQGVGTIEYLFDPDTKQYFFLELNPRLQVEHPVTELITGVNLVAAQVNVAMGIPLYRVPDIRRFYLKPDIHGESVIDFDTAPRAPPKGHVIAVRITGENPDEGFKPTSGGIQELTFRSNANVWGYFSVGPSGGLHEFADSQFGHVFSHGSTREESRKELIVALKNMSIRGEISNIATYACFLLETDVFKKNGVTTGWLDGLIETDVHEEKPDQWLVVICGALHKARTASDDRVKQYGVLLSRGQTPPRELLKHEDFVELIYLNTKYQFHIKRCGSNTFLIYIRNHPEKAIEADTIALGDGGFLMMFHGKSNVVYGTETVQGLKLVMNGKTCMFSTEYDPTKLRATTAGKLVRYLVENGGHIAAPGTAYAEVEIMKMLVTLRATESGKITFVAPEGSILEAGAVIATFVLDDPSKVRTAKVFDGLLPDMKAPKAKGEKAHQMVRECTERVRAVIAGFYHPDVKKLVNNIFIQLYNPHLPILEFKDCCSRIVNRLPRQFVEELYAELLSYEEKLKENTQVVFSGKKIKDLIDGFNTKLNNATKQKEFTLLVQPLVSLAHQFESGLEKHAETLLCSFIHDYLAAENDYQGNRDDVVSTLRQKYKGIPKKVYDIEASHANLTLKNKLMVALLDEIGTRNIAPYSFLLHELSDLMGPDQHIISLKARRMLIIFQLPSFEQLRVSMETDLLSRHFDHLISQAPSIFHIITAFFHHNSQALRENSLEVYLRRAYRAYDIKEFKVEAHKTGQYLKAEMFYLPPFGWEDGGNSNSLPRVESDNNLLAREREAEDAHGLHKGVLFLFDKEEYLFSSFENIVQNFNPVSSPNESSPRNVLKLSVDKQGDIVDEVEIAKYKTLFQANVAALRRAKIRRVTVVLTKFGSFPSIYTFRERMGFDEHPIYRHIEPPLAFHLELRRLSNFEIQRVPTENQQIHLYYGEPNKKTEPFACFFARAVVRGGVPGGNLVPASETVIAEAEHVLTEACNALEVARGEKRYKDTWNNHIFLRFVIDVYFDPDSVVNIIQNLANKFEKRLGRLKVGTVEVVGRLRKPDPNHNPTVLRFIITNPTGYRFNIEAYLEVKDVKMRRYYLGTLFGTGSMDGKDVMESHPLPSLLQRKRMTAHTLNTTYVYDYVELFDEAVRRAWKTYYQERNITTQIPVKVVSATELVLNSNDELVEIDRPPAQNQVGMVAWKLTLFTPEYPKGRDVMIIANDITQQIGSFGTAEDLLFKKVSQLAREKGLPRIYIAANSGARIGLADEVKEQFRVRWVDDKNPAKGFQYLYLNDEEYRALQQLGSINAKKVGDNCWMITDIIGKGKDLGVENLSGSGLIAGETSQAYDEIFTITMVTGRTVGIGAYLVRLGQRTVQTKGPIILTGASALNKVLGRKVYSSNFQLGGTQVMYSNGVSHLICHDDLQGVADMVNWLSFIPAKKNGRLPVIDPVDPVDRLVDFTPSKQPYDPRHMLAGTLDASGKWLSGFFDKGSFVETLSGWAKTVVVGRARLGGIPMGVIAVETRTLEQTKPADPAVDESQESVMLKAGQVWFPDSAYKTSQAIRDFNKGEQLPLIIFANWRGFSGGLRDLFEEILKYGSYIVDALREYKQPVFIYIPPFGELRGGAWVVVDPSINSDMMEMYCDEQGRGGVLEPNGTVEVKYKEKDLIKTMHRLDPQLQLLDKELQKKPAEAELKKLQEQIARREKELMPTYEQLAISFADLHDTAGRMKAKGVIREVLAWKTARKYFYNRVKRRMEEEYLSRKMREVFPGMTQPDIMNFQKKWFFDAFSDKKPEELYNDEAFVCTWLEKNQQLLDQKLRSLRASYITKQVQQFAIEDPVAAVEGLIGNLSAEQKAALLQKLK